MDPEPRPGEHPEEPEEDREPASLDDHGFTPIDLARLFGESGEGESLGSAEDSESREALLERENRTPRKLFEKPVQVTAVYQQTMFDGSRSFFVQLKDAAERELRMVVGAPEASSISMAAEGYRFHRPLTHDLALTIIDRTGWKVDRILIDDLYNDTYYAKLTLTRENEVIDIDCRPSDAIALALRSRRPIFVAEEVLKTATKNGTTAQEGDSSE